MARPKILFVGMQSSSHVARWIRLIADQGWDLHVFPVNTVEPNFDLQGVTIHWPRGGVSRADPARAPQLEHKRLAMANLTDRLARYGRIAAAHPGRTAQRLRDRVLSYSPLTSLVRLRFHYFNPSPADLGDGQSWLRLGESDAAAPATRGPAVLASVIRGVRPDLIHSMEFQHAGYLVLRARELYGGTFPKWLATNWGSDIFYFGRFEDHRAQIRRLLQAVDFYSCECQRDVEIARQFGYTGPVLPVLPNAGGFDLKRLAALRSPVPPSRRRLIMVKGYEHFAGRALTALRALERCADMLKGYRIVLFSATAEPRRRAMELKRAGVLDIKIIDWAPHATILAHFAKARLYVGIGISDAISTSLLEAMAFGAFPIQTDTSCCQEWFADGLGGYAVPPDDFDTICDRIRRALQDDELVDRAGALNWETVKARLDNAKLKLQVAAMYRDIVGTGFAMPQQADRR